jgi:hypothetical protein
MGMSRDDWNGQLSTQRAYDLYNSAGLLVYWLLHRDGRGDGAGFAAYSGCAAAKDPSGGSRAGAPAARRTSDQIATELKALARRMALEVTME